MISKEFTKANFDLDEDIIAKKEFKVEVEVERRRERKRSRARASGGEGHRVGGPFAY